MAASKDGNKNLGARLEALFDAERAVRAAHAEIGDEDPKVLVPALATATQAALALEDEEERALRLVRIASLLAELDGDRVVDLLIDVLGCDDPEPRHAAGEALEDLAYDRFKEVALGIERAVERLPGDHLALLELPYLLSDVPEPGVMKLLDRFLAHANAEVVAAAIEALVEYGDPAGAASLARLEKDARVVRLEDDESGEEGKATIGELAAEAKGLLANGGAARGR